MARPHCLHQTLKFISVSLELCLQTLMFISVNLELCLPTDPHVCLSQSRALSPPPRTLTKSIVYFEPASKVYSENLSLWKTLLVQDCWCSHVLSFCYTHRIVFSSTRKAFFQIVPHLNRPKINYRVCLSQHWLLSHLEPDFCLAPCGSVLS